MLFIQTEQHRQRIEEFAISRSKDINEYLYKIQWTLEQLSGKEKVDDLSDWKIKFGKNKKKKKKVKEQ